MFLSGLVAAGGVSVHKVHKVMGAWIYIFPEFAIWTNLAILWLSDLEWISKLFRGISIKNTELFNVLVKFANSSPNYFNDNSITHL